MDAPHPIRLDDDRPQAALATFKRDRPMWIDGRDDRGAGETIERLSPAHGALASRVPSGSAADANRAIACARKAFDEGSWPGRTGGERSRVLLKTADLIDRDRELLAALDALESGKPISRARSEIEGAADLWRYAAALARDLHGETYSTLGPNRLGFVLHEPISVVAMIAPWNFPLLIVSQKLPLALAAGCAAVVMPSEMTSSSTLHLAHLLDEAGLPAGICNVVTGYGPEVGAPMTSDERVDMISFTGSTGVGRKAMAASSTLKKVSMELGRKNPQLVFPDADLEAALDAVLFGAYFNVRECCNGGSRLLVHQSIAETFVAALVDRSRDVEVGDPLDPQTKVGANINADHLAKIEGPVDAALRDGASAVLGGRRLASSGLFMAPTILDRVTPDMPIARDEVFGPVLSVLTFASTKEAIALGNRASYGLSASVRSRDLDTVTEVGRKVRAGTVWANTFMDGYAELPFGGFKQSGLGRELGRNAAADYTEEKTFHLHDGPRSHRWLEPRIPA